MDGQSIRSHPRRFETKCEVFFVFNGTSANSLSLASLCQSYHSILCHEIAHMKCRNARAGNFLRTHQGPAAAGRPRQSRPASIDARSKTDRHSLPKPRDSASRKRPKSARLYTPDETQGVVGRGAAVWFAGPHGWCAVCQCVASLGVAPKEITGSGRGRPEFRRHEERHRTRRGGGVLQLRTGA